MSAKAQNLTVRDIMREPSMAGMRPDSEKLSPDGRRIVFAWNAEGREPRNLYIVDARGGEPRILVNAEQNFEARTPPAESKLNYGLIVRDDFVRAREKNLGGVEFSPDSKRILFLQNTDIYVLDLEAKEAKPRRITRTQGAEVSARWLTNDGILYQSGGNFFVLNLRETSLVQVTKEANPQAFITIFNANATEDGKMLAYVLSDGSRQRALFVPNYLDEFTQAPTTRRGFTEQKVFVTLSDGSREKPFEINLPRGEGASFIRSVKWAADNSSLLIDRVDKDTKRRQLFFVRDAGSKAEQIILVTEETDPKWIAPLSRIVEPHPKDVSQILFASEKDGFNHLYLATLERRKREPNPTGEIRQENPTDAGFTTNVSIKQLTKGNFEIDWAKWTAGGTSFLFSSTEENSAEREFYSFDARSGDKAKIYDVEKGLKTNPQIDKVNEQPILLYEFSRWNQPTELYAVKTCVGCRGLSVPKRITESTPESFKKIAWSAPKFVDIPTRDGKNVKAKIYLPDNFGQNRSSSSSAKRVFPMVIFVHGAGYLQNTINGWNNYYREFMFHTILTRKGYVVLDIDYRGSAGYGRDWRTDVYDFLGGKDYDDHLDAIDFAVKNYAVNPQKIGVYGGSYGGFMAEMLVMRAPERIAAAAALRPVADWKNYFASSPVYTAERLGFPDKNPEAYRRSSPIAYADKLQKPLLILHGLVDDNVHAQDSIQLIEKLIRLEKTSYFEAMMYPSENHGFQRPTSWADEYERILMFFEKHLN
ncbi:MAG TPA: alpha/beta fold hydrolase [Pyrinomonadaceae bacterium]